MGTLNLIGGSGTVFPRVQWHFDHFNIELTHLAERLEESRRRRHYTSAAMTSAYRRRRQSTSSPLTRPSSALRAYAAVCMLYNRFNPFSLAEVGQAVNRSLPVRCVSVISILQLLLAKYRQWSVHIMLEKSSLASFGRHCVPSRQCWAALAYTTGVGWPIDIFELHNASSHPVAWRAAAGAGVGVAGVSTVAGGGAGESGDRLSWLSTERSAACLLAVATVGWQSSARTLVGLVQRSAGGAARVWLTTRLDQLCAVQHCHQRDIGTCGYVDGRLNLVVVSRNWL